MKNALRLLVLAPVLATAVVVTTSSQASAISCSISRSKTSSYTQVTNGNCYRVQARITRLVGSVPQNHYGPISTSFSSVNSSDGAEAGHASNKSLKGTSEIWDGWSTF